MKPFIKKKLRHQAVHECNLNMDRQVCVIKTMAYRAWTDRHNHRRMDKSLKTEGPKILSNYIFYFKTVIFGGPIDNNEQKLHDINALHSSLTFTLIERETDGSLPMLDMNILNHEGNLSSTWYSKPNSTGLTMNYHVLAPQKYRRAVVTGLVHRIFRSCSN